MPAACFIDKDLEICRILSLSLSLSLSLVSTVHWLSPSSQSSLVVAIITVSTSPLHWPSTTGPLQSGCGQDRQTMTRKKVSGHWLQWSLTYPSRQHSSLAVTVITSSTIPLHWPSTLCGLWTRQIGDDEKSFRSVAVHNDLSSIPHVSTVHTASLLHWPCTLCDQRAGCGQDRQETTRKKLKVN